MKINPETISNDEKFIVSVDVTNSGECTGAEITQLYVQDVEASIERPLKELKGFKKIHLNPGETKEITFELGMEDLSFYDENLNGWKAEKGFFNILIGSSSRDIRLQNQIEYLG
jgi:beta-glucosidase